MTSEGQTEEQPGRPQKLWKRAFWLWGPVAAWMAGIFFVSGISFRPGEPGIPDWLTHGLTYMVLGLLLSRALAGGSFPLSPARMVLALAIAIGYGISDELHQSFVPGRYADPWDLVKDAGGALAGVWAWRRRHAGPAPAAAPAPTEASAR